MKYLRTINHSFDKRWFPLSVIRWIEFERSNRTDFLKKVTFCLAWFKSHISCSCVRMPPWSFKLFLISALFSSNLTLILTITIAILIGVAGNVLYWCLGVGLQSVRPASIPNYVGTRAVCDSPTSGLSRTLRKVGKGFRLITITKRKIPFLNWSLPIAFGGDDKYVDYEGLNPIAE